MPRTPWSVLCHTLALSGHSSGLTQFTLNQSNYNSILILLTTIGFPLLSIGCSVLAADMKRELFGCCFVPIYLFDIARSILNICEGNLMENKIVGIFMHKMRICKKYHILWKNKIKTITNNNLTWFNMQ